MLETRFVLAMPSDEPQCPDSNGCEAAEAFDGPVSYESVGGTVEVCLSAK